MSHTPGPWRADRAFTTRNNPCWIIDSPTVAGLAVLEFRTTEDCDGVGAANARLIQAAPSMYQWLINMATDEQLDTPVPALGGKTGRQLLAEIDP